MITKNFLMTDGSRFAVEVPASAVLDAIGKGEKAEDWKASYTYRIAVKHYENTGRTCRFVETDVDGNWVYVGCVEADGTVRMTAGSKISPEKPRVRIVQRLVKAVFDGRGDAVEKAGYKVYDTAKAPAPVASDLPTPAPAKLSGPHRFIADIFTVAVGYGLKRPMLRVHFRDRRFKFYLSKRGTICLKTGQLTVPTEEGGRDPVGDEEYAGCLLRGEFRPARASFASHSAPVERKLLPAEEEFMCRMAKDAVGFIAQCGKDMCRCCYCGQPLEDVRSKAVGYGETCAKRWGLPWGGREGGGERPQLRQELRR